jgi:hypothetical protein
MKGEEIGVEPTVGISLNASFMSTYVQGPIQELQSGQVKEEKG